MFKVGFESGPSWLCILLQKEEMGEVLHEVDFNQLKIENQQYLEKIDERNQDLLRLKMMHTSTQQVLNTFKVQQCCCFHYTEIVF